MLLCANGFALAAAARDLAGMGVEVPGQMELAGMADAGPFDLLRHARPAWARVPSGRWQARLGGRVLTCLDGPVRR
ncbi:hypothetical protein ACFXJ8_35935 [Nonomuraea sp. NPDC059194]|uniref:hypothetical protein n=1 Tax=Nonomuraea sp. NPDC059194 TaxID=3346764 RepID=UPI00369DEA92